MKKRNSRAVAAAVIEKWLADYRFPDRELARVERDHAFVTELVCGVVRRWKTLDWIVRFRLRREPPPFVLAALYAGVYQLCFMENVEEYAAIHETVEAVRSRSTTRSFTGLVNAVLRRVQRERERIFAALERQPDDIRLSHPRFLLRRWARQFGEAEARRLAEWNNLPPQTVLRVLRTHIEPENFLAEMKAAGIELVPHPADDSGSFFILPRGMAVHRLPGYEEGWFTVQDPATAAAVKLLRVRPGEAVLDACAAPGGKTAMLAERLEGEGSLTAMDLHEDRLDRLRENLRRLRLEGAVEVVKGDAREAGKVLGDRRFDAILLDVPCLNTGVLRRRPDARWRVTPRRLESIVETQYALLDGCAPLLKPGGRLVYSTCSLEPEENEDLVARWVREHPGFRRMGARRLFPPKSNTDGAFAALIVRDR